MYGEICPAKRENACEQDARSESVRRETAVKAIRHKNERRYPELLVPGEKVQEEVKEVPYNCLKGAAKRDGKHLYQRTAIDECTGIRFIYGFEEHTPENSVKFFMMLQRTFPLKIQVIQTDNGTEFTHKYLSETES